MGVKFLIPDHCVSIYMKLARHYIYSNQVFAMLLNFIIITFLLYFRSKLCQKDY